MAIEDYIKPVEDHVSGIPSIIRAVIANLSLQSSQRTISVIRTAYDSNVKLIEDTLAGKDVPLDKEEMAAGMVSHLILDTAFIHDALSRAGVPVGPFPFDYLADKLMPKPKNEDTNDVQAEAE